MLTRLIPNIFYSSLNDGLELFVTHLGFKVLYQEDGFAVIERDAAKAYLVESAEFAAKDRPEITIETDRIDDLFREVQSKAPHILHPGAQSIKETPWGARQFAVRDKTDVCVIFRQG